ncbi:MAG: cryptochrome/photolyase family protein, partial [Spirochaetaceae bacterium]|nr:cryptochrome/photolyase family protein [Spirochaetaceae bacterium]MCF7950713.1 cryptochrome/photolyase family protein [Spirochaetaceae bacterium]
MTRPLLLVMGNQLYPTHKVGLMEGSTARRRGYADLGPAPLPVFMAEDPVRCRRFRYHTHKLLLILSSMRSHRDFLSGRHELYYYSLEDTRSYFEKLKDAVRRARADALVAYELDDRRLEGQLEEYAARLGLPLSFRPSKSFLTSGRELQEKLRENPGEPEELSEAVREPGEEPKAFPEDIRFLPLPRADWTAHTRRLAGEIAERFPDNPGDPTDFFLPTSRGQALKWLDSFVQYRLPQFGSYQSAIHQSELLGFHSLLSPLLNIGLLFPGEVVEA